MLKDQALEKDIKDFCNSDIQFSDYKNKTFLITGSTGLVGSLIIKYLLVSSKKKNLNIKVLAQIRNVEKAENIFSEFLSYSELEFIQYDVREKIDISNDIDYIIHCASTTTSKEIVSFPVDTMDTLYIGTKNILELSKQKNVKKLIYVSSMEVYGDVGSIEKKTSESDLGDIDILNTRSVYPLGKRACECLCNAYAEQYGVNVVIARLAQTFGAGVPKNDNRVFAYFAKNAIANEDIILRSTGDSYGNYCYSLDAITGLFTLIDKGIVGEAYNINNETTTMKIKDVAQLVSNVITDGKVAVKFDIEDAKTSGFAPDVQLRLSSEKLNKLGWSATVSLEESFKRLVESLKS